MRIQQSKEVLVADFSKNKVIFNLNTYVAYILNHAASEIWGFLHRPRKEAEILRFLTTKYNLRLTQAKQDLKEYIQQLKQRGLVKLIKDE